MVMGGGWAWLAASCGGSWLGHSGVVVMGIGLRAWFVGLQQRWSVRLRARLSIVQLHYDNYYSRYNLMHSDSLQMYNCLVVMEFILRVGFVGPQRPLVRTVSSLVLRCYDINLGIQEWTVIVILHVYQPGDSSMY